MPRDSPLLVFCLIFVANFTFASEEPFKLGTFEHDGEEILGVVLRDSLVVDLARANASLERHHPLWVELPMPATMNELIGRYEYGMRECRPAYVYDLTSLYTLPPVRPGLILAAALNYRAHATEMTTGTPADMSDASALDDAPVSMDHFWQRKPGDLAECSVEGIGTLRNPVRMGSDEMPR